MSHNTNNNNNNDNIEDGNQEDDIMETIMSDNNIRYRRERMTWTLNVVDFEQIASSLLQLIENRLASISYDADDPDELGLPNDPVALATVEAMEKIRFERNSDIGQSETDMCPICLEGFELGFEITRTSCSHVFHGDCLVKWIEKRNTCPMCRVNINIKY